jgi:hypothetical protein
MRNQPRAVFKLIGAAVLATLLAACGSGGDSGSDGTTAEVIPSDVVRIEFVVSDKETNVPVGGAVASYQGGDKYTSTPTNADGSGRLDLPAAELATTESPQGTVSKEGYEPQTLPVSACKLIPSGKVCILPDVQLIKVAPNVSIPVGGDAVWHLGDEKFVASGVNTLFQKATDTVTLLDADPLNDQPFLEFAIPDWAAKVQAGGYTKATVTLDIKGMQATICPNDAIALSGDAGTPTLLGKDSPVDGSWRRDPFEFAVASVGATSTNVRIVVTTGRCPVFDATGQLVQNDFDDFEINRLRVEFSK